VADKINQQNTAGHRPTHIPCRSRLQPDKGVENAPTTALHTITTALA